MTIHRHTFEYVYESGQEHWRSPPLAAGDECRCDFGAPDVVYNWGEGGMVACSSEAGNVSNKLFFAFSTEEGSRECADGYVLSMLPGLSAHVSFNTKPKGYALQPGVRYWVTVWTDYDAPAGANISLTEGKQNPERNEEPVGPLAEREGIPGAPELPERPDRPDSERKAERDQKQEARQGERDTRQTARKDKRDERKG